MSVTTKIILLATWEDDVAKVCEIGQGAVRVPEPAIGMATLFESQVEAGPRTPFERRRRAIRGRFDRPNAVLSDKVAADHTVEAIGKCANCGAGGHSARQVEN